MAQSALTRPQKVVGSGNQIGRLTPEAFADPPKRENRNDALAPFHKPHIGSVHAHMVGKPFLGEPLFLASLPHHRAKGFCQLRSFHASEGLNFCGI